MPQILEKKNEKVDSKKILQKNPDSEKNSEIINEVGNLEDKYKKGMGGGTKWLIIAIVIIAIIISFFAFITWSVIDIRSSEIDNISDLISKNQQGNRSLHMLVKFFQIHQNLKQEENEQDNLKKELMYNSFIPVEKIESIKVKKEEKFLEPMVRAIIEFIDRLLGINSNSKDFYNDVLLRKAYIEERNRHYVESIELFKQFLKENPNVGNNLQADIYLHIGFNYAVQNMIKEAKEYFRKIYDLVPKNSDTYSVAIQIEAIMNQLEREQQKNKEAIEKIKQITDDFDIDELLKTFSGLLNTNDLKTIQELAKEFTEKHSKKVTKKTPLDNKWRIGVSAVYYFWGRSLEEQGGKVNIDNAISYYRTTINTGKTQEIEKNKVREAVLRISINSNLYDVKSTEIDEIKKDETFKNLEKENKDAINIIESAKQSRDNTSTRNENSTTSIFDNVNTTFIGDYSSVKDEIKEEVKKIETEKIVNDNTISEEEKRRLEREKAEKERLEREKAEKERLEKEAAEKAEKERLEKEAAEKAEKERLEKEAAEKAEKERLEKEAAEKAEKERLEKEAAEKAEKERLEKEAAEKAEKERLEKEAAEKAEKERLEREAEEERLAKEERRKTAEEEIAKKLDQAINEITIADNKDRFIANIDYNVSNLKFNISYSSTTFNLVDLKDLQKMIDMFLDNINDKNAIEYLNAEKEIIEKEWDLRMERQNRIESLEDLINKAIEEERLKINFDGIKYEEETVNLDETPLNTDLNIEIIGDLPTDPITSLINDGSSNLVIDFKSDLVSIDVDNDFITEISLIGIAEDFKKIAISTNNYLNLVINIISIDGNSYEGKVIKQEGEYYILENESGYTFRVYKDNIYSITITDNYDNIISVVSDTVFNSEKKIYDVSRLLEGKTYLFTMSDGSQIEGVFAKVKGSSIIVTVVGSGNTIALKIENILYATLIDPGGT